VGGQPRSPLRMQADPATGAMIVAPLETLGLESLGQ
jgi:hypothetical protein